jgi:hypothetical protein
MKHDFILFGDLTPTCKNKKTRIDPTTKAPLHLASLPTKHSRAFRLLTGSAEAKNKCHDVSSKTGPE